MKVKPIEWEQVCLDVYVGNVRTPMSFMIINLELRLNNVIQAKPFVSLQEAKDKAQEILNEFIAGAVEEQENTWHTHHEEVKSDIGL